MGDTWLSIPEIAKSMGTTKQTVYTRIKAAGMNLEELESKTRSRVKYYAPEAVERIKALFVENPSASSKDKEPVTDKKEQRDLTEELERLREQVKRLEAEKEEQRQQITQLTNVVTRDQTLLLNEQMRVAELTAELKRLNDQRLLSDAVHESNQTPTQDPEPEAGEVHESNQEPAAEAVEVQESNQADKSNESDKTPFFVRFFEKLLRKGDK